MTDTETTIERHDNDDGGRYVALVDGFDATGVLDYRRAADGRLIADHTGVPDEMGGRGVGKALVMRLAADARAAGVRIVPRCPFVKALLERDKSLSDLIA